MNAGIGSARCYCVFGGACVHDPRSWYAQCTQLDRQPRARPHVINAAERAAPGSAAGRGPPTSAWPARAARARARGESSHLWALRGGRRQASLRLAATRSAPSRRRWPRQLSVSAAAAATWATTALSDDTWRASAAPSSTSPWPRPARPPRRAPSSWASACSSWPPRRRSPAREADRPDRPARPERLPPRPSPARTPSRTRRPPSGVPRTATTARRTSR